MKKQRTALLTSNKVISQQRVETNHANERKTCFFKCCVNMSKEVSNLMFYAQSTNTVISE